MRAVAAALCLSLAMNGPVLAQGAAKAPAKDAKPAPEPPPAPYEPQLLRLSEILGALAYLRDICGTAKDGEEWRAQMTRLLEAEATTGARKARFAGAYNAGFRGFELTYRTCTPNARLVVSRYLEEGLKIVRDVSNRYGGG